MCRVSDLTRARCLRSYRTLRGTARPLRHTSQGQDRTNRSSSGRTLPAMTPARTPRNPGIRIYGRCLWCVLHREGRGVRGQEETAGHEEGQVFSRAERRDAAYHRRGRLEEE